MEQMKREDDTRKMLRELMFGIQIFLEESKEERAKAVEDRNRAEEDRKRAEEDRRRAEERFEEYVRQADERLKQYASEAARDRKAFMLLIKQGFKLGNEIIRSLKRIEKRLNIIGNGQANS